MGEGDSQQPMQHMISTWECCNSVFMTETDQNNQTGEGRGREGGIRETVEDRKRAREKKREL